MILFHLHLEIGGGGGGAETSRLLPVCCTHLLLWNAKEAAPRLLSRRCDVNSPRAAGAGWLHTSVATLSLISLVHCPSLPRHATFTLAFVLSIGRSGSSDSFAVGDVFGGGCAASPRDTLLFACLNLSRLSSCLYQEVHTRPLYCNHCFPPLVHFFLQ